MAEPQGELVQIKVETADFSYWKPEVFVGDKQNGTGHVHVIRGKFRGKTDAALKRYDKAVLKLKPEEEAQMKMIQRDLAALEAPQHLSEHFVRYFGSVTQGNHIYIATELCLCSLAKWVTGKHDWNKESLPNKEILRQSAEGVAFLHGLGYIHRRLSPSNFLIAEPTTGKFVVKLSDFRFSRFYQDTTDIFQSDNPDLNDWTAPECLEEDALLLPAVDVFILGCLFFYVMTGGRNPFGDKPNGRKIIFPEGEYDLNDSKVDSSLRSLIERMIEKNPLKRPALWKVLSDNYFCPEENYPIYGVQDVKPGLCVIVNQELFLNPDDDRKGSGCNTKLLWDTFLPFGYDVLLYENLSGEQLLRLTEDLVRPPNDAKVFCPKAREVDFEKYSSLVVCLMSHGGKGTICGIDGVEVSLNRIKYAFNSFDCPSLMGKPKIFIIQACRGDLQLPRRSTAVNATDEASFTDIIRSILGGKKERQNEYAEYQPTGKLLKAIEDYQMETCHPLPPLVDMLTLSATVEEFVGYRFNFIPTLCDELKNNRQHLIVLFKEVVRKMSGNDMNQTPEVSSTLRKNILFQYDSHASPPPLEITGDGYSSELRFKGYRKRNKRALKKLLDSVLDSVSE